MLRSFSYAAETVRLGSAAGVNLRTEDAELIRIGANFWERWVSAIFLRAYLDAAAAGGFLPATIAELRVLLNAYVLEKALYELGYELNNRPEWIGIPVQGMLQLLEGE